MPWSRAALRFLPSREAVRFPLAAPGRGATVTVEFQDIGMASLET